MESIRATHNFEVANFSLLDGAGIGRYASSRTFSGGGYDWNIRLYPDGCRMKGFADCVSIYLCFLGGGRIGST